MKTNKEKIKGFFSKLNPAVYRSQLSQYWDTVKSWRQCPECGEQLTFSGIDEIKKKKGKSKIFHCKHCGTELNIPVEMKDAILEQWEQVVDAAKQVKPHNIMAAIRDNRHPLTVAIIGLIAIGVLNAGGFGSFTAVVTLMSFLIGPWGIVILLLVAAIWILHRKRIEEVIRQKKIHMLAESDRRLSSEALRLNLTLGKSGTLNCQIRNKGGLVKEERIITKGVVIDSFERLKKWADITTDYNRLKVSGVTETGEYENKVTRELENWGKAMMPQLLPASAIEILKTASKGLLVLEMDASLAHLPWELLHDSVDFLCKKFDMSREIILPSSVKYSERVVDAEEVRMLIISDPTESLPGAARESESIFRALNGLTGIDVTMIQGKVINKTQLVRMLPEYDIVHYAGHARYNPKKPRESGWILHRDVLTAYDMTCLFGGDSKPPGLIFSNSCSSGIALDWEKSCAYEKTAAGLAGSFIGAGVKNYIGTFWRVSDEASALFAQDFYKRLFLGKHVATALKEARRNLYNTHRGREIIWASYMLFGPPAWRATY
ncbi:MAG TPA: CHAT domain-containing protein [Alphaproteobacteria bacterium]|nr:CHAT domain-containing protein [Alphaproteobacteria bacterium]